MPVVLEVPVREPEVLEEKPVRLACKCIELSQHIAVAGGKQRLEKAATKGKKAAPKGQKAAPKGQE